MCDTLVLAASVVAWAYAIALAGFFIVLLGVTLWLVVSIIAGTPDERRLKRQLRRLERKYERIETAIGNGEWRIEYETGANPARQDKQNV